MCRVERNKGGREWDNSNSILNKIHLKNKTSDIALIFTVKLKLFLLVDTTYYIVDLNFKLF